MRRAADYKWRRLRRWLTERKGNDEAHARTRTMFSAKIYHETRAEVFKAVLIVSEPRG